MLDTQDFPALRCLGLNTELQQALLALKDPTGTWPARITEVHRDRYTLLDAHGSRSAQALPELTRELLAQGTALAVGDWVLAAEDGWIHQRVPPRNLLTRRSPDGQLQTLVANVDTALIVMGLDHDFNLARLDRYLLLTRSAGLDSVIVLSKADLCPQLPARLAALQAHLAQSSAPPVLAVDGTLAAAREALRPWLGEGRSLVLLGSSGAGKSTLTNTLCGATLQDTGGVRQDDSRGRHTTTARSLHRTPEGACIIDTPGLRGLSLAESDAAALDSAFDDVSRLAAQCRFRDCRHEEEPGCAVRGALSPARLKSFQKLLRESQRNELDLLQRREQLAQWKQRSRAARERIASKRGGGDAG